MYFLKRTTSVNIMISYLKLFRLDIQKKQIYLCFVYVYLVLVYIYSKRFIFTKKAIIWDFSTFLENIICVSPIEKKFLYLMFLLTLHVVILYSCKCGAVYGCLSYTTRNHIVSL